MNERELVQFVLDKCVCRYAYGGFAYLWSRDWNEFEMAAHELGIDCKAEKTGVKPVYLRKKGADEEEPSHQSNYGPEGKHED